MKTVTKYTDNKGNANNNNANNTNGVAFGFRNIVIGQS